MAGFEVTTEASHIEGVTHKILFPLFVSAPDESHADHLLAHSANVLSLSFDGTFLLW
jgi:hypothetical protein